MKKYEAMFIIKPDLTEEERKNLFNQISEAVLKNHGNVINTSIWSEKKKLHFTIKKCNEGVYYLMNFTVPAEALAKIRHAYNLNENILRALITRID